MDPNNPHPYRMGRKKYIEIRKKYFGESYKEAGESFQKYKECLDNRMNSYECVMTFGESLQETTTITYPWTKKEGTTPVNTERNYLLGRLNEAQYPKRRELEKKYNVFGDNTPRNYKELIEAIKKGKYTLDEKVVKKIEGFIEDDLNYLNNPFYGIIWDGPKIDYDGFNEATNEMNKQLVKAKDIISVNSPEEGLKALHAFEAWLPK